MKHTWFFTNTSLVKKNHQDKSKGFLIHALTTTDLVNLVLYNTIMGSNLYDILSNKHA